ncbi:MAG: 30S ribosomal protein S19 [archaeon]|nr:30S ribosomal protein S19 [archaeon]
MVKQEFTYKGKTIEELQKLSIAQFAELCPSRIKRSLLKGTDEHFLKKVAKAQESLAAGKYPKPVRTHNRDNIVIPAMIGIAVSVHNGKDFVNVDVKEKMLGHYLGELVLTRKRLLHGKAGIGATRSSTAITAR